MGFFSKLAFWKKGDLGLDKDFGSELKNMDFGGIGENSGFSNDLGHSPEGMTDVSNFRGVGDFRSQQEMNRNLDQQMDSMRTMPVFPTFPSNQTYQEVRPVGNHDHELEVISAKLDAIRANLDAINQRLANLERVAYGEQERSRVRW